MTDLHAIHRDLAESLSRAYSTALTLLGDASSAETLVMGAVDGLDVHVITSSAIRNAVVHHLVRAQIGSNYV